jgi:hypothetical protein
MGPTDCHVGGVTPNGEKIPHGAQCECVQLAAALGLPAKAISFYYCRNFLQRRWSMTCRHGELLLTPPPPRSERWKEQGEMNPVLAILVENA